MLATPERIPGHGRARDQTVWHKPAPGHRCAGDCDFHPIACSAQEGIAVPGPKQDVPLHIDKDHETWCANCLSLIREQRANTTKETPR